MSFVFETVSVDEAIKKGRQDVVLPSVLILVSSILIGFAGFIFTSLVLYFPLVMVAGPMLAVLYYSKRSAKWRIWAFENVRNVHELKQRARNFGLMKDDGSPVFFNIGVSKADIEKINALQEKFKRPDIFADDPNVPLETVVYYSKTKKYLTLLFYVPILGLGIVIMFLHNMSTYMYVWGVFLIILSGGLFFVTIKDTYNRKPQIILNNEGMSTAETPFHEWHLINNEGTILTSSGKSRSIYLKYNYPGGSTRFLLDGFTINRAKLDNLLRVYKGRATQKANRS